MRTCSASSVSLLAAGCLALALAPGNAAAQRLLSRPAQAASYHFVALAPRLSAEAMGVMAADLSRLVSYEQLFRVHFSTFTDDAAFTGFEPSEGVRVEVLWARKDAWAARATHSSFPGHSCVIWVGRILQRDSIPRTAAERKSPPEGLAACDHDGTTPAEAERQLATDFMRSTLWRLTYAEGRRAQAHAAFTSDLSLLDGFQESESVIVTVLSASSEGWSAVAVHPAASGRSCVVWGGKVAKESRPVTRHRLERSRRPGEVVCDD